MHRSSRSLLPFDPEIERTFRRRQRSASRESVEVLIEELFVELPLEERMAEQEVNRRALRDFALPSAQGSQTSITRPTVNANNFEIKPSLIQMVQ